MVLATKQDLTQQWKATHAIFENGFKVFQYYLMCWSILLHHYSNYLEQQNQIMIARIDV